MKTQLAPLAAAALLLTPTVGRADPPAKQLYETYCVQCHGLSAIAPASTCRVFRSVRATIRIARAWAPRPTTNSSRPSRKAAWPSDKSVLMPTWGGVLTDPQITELVKYLRQVCHCGS